MGECCKMELSDLNFTPTGAVVKIVRKKTDKANIGQTFFIPIEYSEYIKEYTHLRITCNSPRLWLSYNKKTDNFNNQPMGINTMSKIPCLIAEFLNLENPKEYTGHCFRSSSVTALADNGVSMENMKRHGGWKSGSVVEGYFRDSKRAKMDIATALATTSTSTSTTTTTSSTNSTIVSPTHVYSGPVFINCVLENVIIEKKE
jgi:integrase